MALGEWGLGREDNFVRIEVDYYVYVYDFDVKLINQGNRE